MEIIDLPHDLFLLIVARLSARPAVLCRRVSRRWNAAFTDEDLSLQLLKWHFPRCREMRLLYAASAGAGGISEEPSVPAATNGCLLAANNDGSSLHPVTVRHASTWMTLFAQVAGRYHHLRTATPRSVEKIRLGAGSKEVFYGVGTWDRYLRLDDKTAPFHYPDPSWCYGQEDGVLVYHVHPDEVTDVPPARAYVYPWRLLDLESREEVEVPFPYDDDKIVRRLRLVQGVLVFEWCERLAYHQLNEREECHRHYVTAFNVTRTSVSRRSSARTAMDPTTWTITPRAEFKFHFLGLPLNSLDRFLSAHTKTHYVVYVWQPNRSPWGEDDPIESVIIWDITSPTSPPRIIRRMTWSTLAFYGVRQRSTPKLRCLGLDDRNLYFVEEEHRWAQGGHSSLSPPRVHLVRSTGVPVIPGPVQPPPAGGDTGEDRRGQSDDDEDQDEEEQVVQGPCWLDQCGANGDVNLSFCSRVEARSRIPPSSISLQQQRQHQHQHLQQQQQQYLPSPTGPGIWHGSLPATSTPTLSQELGAALRASTTRWPGWAPCWRHEEFPYLTVSEMVDFKAGVRVTARHCFMLETLSVHVRPSLSVRGVGISGGGGGGSSSSSSKSSNSSSASSSSSSPGGQEDVGNGAGGNGAARERSIDTRLYGKLKTMDRGWRKGKKVQGAGQRERATNGAGVGGEEVQFSDEMWDELLGKGFICGDERWLVGEDREGRVTIIRF